MLFHELDKKIVKIDYIFRAQDFFSSQENNGANISNAVFKSRHHIWYGNSNNNEGWIYPWTLITVDEKTYQISEISEEASGERIALAASYLQEKRWPTFTLTDVPAMSQASRFKRGPFTFTPLEQGEMWGRIPTTAIKNPCYWSYHVWNPRVQAVEALWREVRSWVLGKANPTGTMLQVTSTRIWQPR